MLMLAHQTLAGRFEVATVDHGLRAAAADEAALVAQLCARHGVAHRTIRLGLGGGAGVQHRARDARYAALAAWLRERGLAALVTAHHLDDQAETLLMRLNRGAGVRGLAGMRPRATLPGDPELPLLRPLLGWRRGELHAVVAAAGLVPADDPSNRDNRFERTRIRAGLASAGWIDPAALAIAARHLAEADAALDWAAEGEWGRVEWGQVGGGANTASYTPTAPRAVRMRVLTRIVVELGARPPRGRDLARWLDALEGGRVATLAGVRGDGTSLRWRFTPARPHRGAPSEPS